MTDDGALLPEPLRTAAEAGDADRCRRLLLAANAAVRRDVGLGAESTLSALQLATLHAPAAAQALLRTGADCDLHSACGLGLTAAIERLAAPRALSALAEHLTPMGFALALGKVDSVAMLLRLGDDANRALARIGFFRWEVSALAAGHGRWRPLHAACAHGYREAAAPITRLLIAHGAEVESACAHGARPLHLAAAGGWTDVIERLLDAGAALDAPTAPTPAALWRLAAPPDAAPVFGQTPLAVAAREGKVAAVRLLLARGANPNAADSALRTPLHAAARPWWRECRASVALLLDAGARVAARDRRGTTPRDLARAAGYRDSAALLARRGV